MHESTATRFRGPRCAALVLATWLAALDGAAAAPTTRAEAIARWPLPERCALIRVVTHEALLLLEWGQPITEPFRFAVLLGEALVDGNLLVRAGEVCAAPSPDSVKAHVKAVEMAVSPPGVGSYEWVRLTSNRDGVMRFERDLSQGCLAVCTPGQVCAGCGVIASPFPRMVIEVARRRDVFEVTKAVLEFGRFQERFAK